ncbi:MAG: asparagine synthase C-terminal domain-containing protein, partial [Actinomycetota bacterium]|nr:asparagine synthase C-terminal domain-containing protein [Actinomycetota bacterium]
AELRARLTDSVAAHLMGDVPVGVLLSGGVDSGGICALAAGHAGPGLPTFSVGFEERSFDELDRARQVARRYATAHTEVVVRARDAADLLITAAASLDEPRGDATEVPYRLAARTAAADVKAVLSGEGSDELFGGYPTYTADHLGPRPPQLAALLAPAVGRLARSSDNRLSLEFRLHRLARGAGLGPLGRHHAWKELLTAAQRSALLGGDVVPGPPAAYAARWAETAGAPLVARLQDVDVGTFLADDLLLQTDRSGMAHGLEVRVPYLDREVAAFALGLPTGVKLRGLETKRVLRHALAPLLPAAVVRGPKKGFVAPVAAWLRGPLEPLARELLSPAILARQGFLAPGPVQALLARHRARDADLSRPLWALIAFGLWVDAHGAHPAVDVAAGASVTSPEPIAS